MAFIIPWFKKKVDLRKECGKRYGEDFLILYDIICRGGTIGNLGETITFIDMVEAVKKELKEKGYKIK